MDEIQGVIVRDGAYAGRRGRILKQGRTGWYRCELWIRSYAGKMYKTIVSLRAHQFTVVRIKGAQS